MGNYPRAQEIAHAQKNGSQAHQRVKHEEGQKGRQLDSIPPTHWSSPFRERIKGDRSPSETSLFIQSEGLFICLEIPKY